MGEPVDDDGFRRNPQNVRMCDNRRKVDQGAWFYGTAHGIEVVTEAHVAVRSVLIPARALRRWAKADAMLAAREDASRADGGGDE